MSLRTYQYRVYPTEKQQLALDQILNMARWLYNRALDYRRKKWNESRYTVTNSELSTMWKEWRNETPDDNPLRLLNMTAGQQILRRLDSNYRQFMQGKRGKPRFKGKRFFNTLNYKTGDGASLKNGKLYMQNVGLVRVKFHRDLPDGELKNIIITRKSSGWYAAFQIEIADVEVIQSTNPPVGIDMGISHALALSEGQFVDSPKYLRQSLRRLCYLQRKLARRTKGSSGRREAVAQLAKEHEHIANQRRDFWHKITYWLTQTYGIIALEDLNLEFMLENRKLSRVSHDIALGLFQQLLDYKANQAGVQIVKVNPRNTSQACSGCGVIVKKELKDRMHICPDCGLQLDRDINAAINILRLGLDQILGKSVGKQPLNVNVSQ